MGCGPAYRIHTRRLVLRCWEPRDAPLLMAAIAVNLEHLRPWLLWVQHEDLKEQLLGTGMSKIVEHTSNDSYWGDGGDGSGKNKLGILLMETREKLRAGS